MRKRKKNSFIRNKIKYFIGENIKLYLLLIIIFFIGISIGIICINNSSEECKNGIAQYINNFIEVLRTNENIDLINIISVSVKKNAIFVLIMFLLGSTVIGMPIMYLVILYKGYCLGYTASSILGTLGIGRGLIIFIILILTYLIYIPSIITIAVCGINLCKSIINFRRETKLGISVFRYAIICTIILILMSIASIIESNILIWIRPLIIKNVI